MTEHFLQELTGSHSLKMVGNQSKMTPAQAAPITGGYKDKIRSRNQKVEFFFYFLVNEEAINTISNIGNCFGRLTSLINEINELSPTLGTKNLKFSSLLC